MSGGQMEFLAGGPEREPRFPRRPQLRMWRPRPFVTVFVLSVLAGAAWVGYVITTPRIPPVRVTQLVGSPSNADQASAPWQPSADGRPSDNVQLSVNAIIWAAHRSGDRVTVLGIVGPGVVGSLAHPIVVPAARQTRAALLATLDCSQVRLPVDEADYRIQMQVVAGWRTTTGSVADGGISATWASSVERACGSWLARRDLTVVQASATLDPQQPNSDLTLMIENSDVRAAYIRLGWNYPALSVSAPSAGEMTLAGGQTSTLHLHVAIGNCDYVPPPFAAASGEFATTADYLGIAALVGSRPLAPNPSTGPSPLDGTAPTGIIIAPGPATAIEQTLRAACANLDQFVTFIAQNGLRLDTRSGVMTVRITIDGTPGKVRDVQLISDPKPADNTAFQPLWTTIASIVPDPSGQVSALLRYGVPVHGASACPSHGAWIPGFTLIAHVIVGDTVKALRYTQSIDPSQDPAAIKTLCPLGAPVP
jgi:hypothetical protein